MDRDPLRAEDRGDDRAVENSGLPGARPTGSLRRSRLSLVVVGAVAGFAGLAARGLVPRVMAAIWGGLELEGWDPWPIWVVAWVGTWLVLARYFRRSEKAFSPVLPLALGVLSVPLEIGLVGLLMLLYGVCSGDVAVGEVPRLTGGVVAMVILGFPMSAPVTIPLGVATSFLIRWGLQMSWRRSWA